MTHFSGKRSCFFKMENKHFQTSYIFIIRSKFINTMYDRRKENNPMFGKKQSEESRARISATQKMRYKTLSEILKSVSNEKLEDKVHRIVEETINKFITTQTIRIK